MSFLDRFELDVIYTHKIEQRSIAPNGQRQINDTLRTIAIYKVTDDDFDVASVGDEELFNRTMRGREYLPPLPSDWDWSWTVQTGQYTGKLGKRISKFYSVNFGVNLSDALLNSVSNIAGSNRQEPTTYYLEFTKNFNWKAGDFGDPNSCFWMSRTKDRFTLQYNGCIAVRFYRDGSDKSSGYARAWIAPNHPRNDTAIIFNGYGFDGDSTLEITKIVCDYFGFEFRELEIRNNRARTDSLYFNNDGRGIVIGEYENIRANEYTASVLALGRKAWTNYDFRWETNVLGQCAVTGRWLSENDWSYTHRGLLYSREGYDATFAKCAITGNSFPLDELIRLQDGRMICEQAWRDMSIPCHYCGERALKDQFQWIDGSALMLCPECIERHTAQCQFTKLDYLTIDTTFFEGYGFLSDEGVQHHADQLINELGVVPNFSNDQLSLLQDIHVINRNDIDDLSSDMVTLGVQDAIHHNITTWNVIESVFTPNQVLTMKAYNKLWWSPVKTSRERV